tara:strand:- start:3132 stop:3407 length:276 start_codon:yes stop_codon:yes gene_type:complete
MDETELLIAEARLGLQTKEFLKSPIGRYIIGRASKAKEEAFNAWTSCNPADVDSIVELQFRARLPALVTGWLDEAINQADYAEQTLTELKE